MTNGADTIKQSNPMTPPENFPAVGTTIYLRPAGSKRRPVGYVIERYKHIDGINEWVFVARSPSGVVLTDGVHTLLRNS